MVTRSLRDTDEFKLGRQGERLVASLLQEIGFWVIPSYDYAGEDHDKPPRLQGSTGALPIPDLDVAKEGQRRWVEVKTKHAATWTTVTGRYEHGMSRSLYERYIEVQSITGAEVWIAVYEVSTGDVLVESLDRLQAVARFYDGSKMGRGRMVFFPRDAFALFKNVGALA